MQHDSAGRQAREVVGLYGDPDTTWGICLELGFDEPIVQSEAEGRAAALVAAFPHLGPRPAVDAVEDDWDRRRESAAAEPYALGDPLVRLLLGNGGRRLLVAAHHGACDGLGLVAIADRVSGHLLLPAARGIGDRSAPVSFLRSSATRLGEALLRPPPRFRPHRVDPGPGETLRVHTQPRTSAGTVDLCIALADVFAEWNGPASAGSAPLFVSGASRRAPGRPVPDRQTAYLRLRYDPAWTAEEVRAAFRSLAPEPEFPETSAGGVGPRITRLLRNRLGATAQLSNLGVVDGDGLTYGAMFPALSGPRGLAVGLVTTASTSTLSLRTRRSEFGPADTDDLLTLIAARLAGR